MLHHLAGRSVLSLFLRLCGNIGAAPGSDIYHDCLGSWFSLLQPSGTYFTQLPDKILNYCELKHLPHVIRNSCVRLRFPTVSIRCRTKQPHRDRKMIYSFVGLSFVDVLWAFLASCFLVALYVHKISTRLPREHETCRPYVLFQDLIRYGKTKENLKRDDCLRVFDVPKR